MWKIKSFMLLGILGSDDIINTSRNLILKISHCGLSGHPPTDNCWRASPCLPSARALMVVEVHQAELITHRTKSGAVIGLQDF